MEGADADNDVVVPVEADINTVRARQTAAASRKLLWSGVLVLPVVWCINIALHRRATTAAKYVTRSQVALAAFVAIWIAWLVTFYANLSSPWAQSLIIGT
ncbi:Gamma-secretase subunit PEN-2 [Plasmodiophora brassicae]|uniref:Gamma-secretase subunit PEN-2 n=1 Tax=Plasmodiophora brassicae TaxID=37360 RepID=A0A0G4J5P9_PLABS|nr:hypothetical protein PBRA_002651 [Plasmodiophora brassicae]SPQ94809.1 unnamed protein product [Plasmodiophora brassicae]